MDSLQDLVDRLNQLVAAGVNRAELRTAARELWEYAGYEAELGDGARRRNYVTALFAIADVLPRETAIEALKRAYALDSGYFEPGVMGSAREAAAYRLGLTYERADSHHNAVWWFKRSLDLAEVTGIRNNTLLNLGALGRNLEFLGLYDAASEYYDRVLEMLSGERPEEQPPVWIIPAALFHVFHGDTVRGEGLIRSWIATNLPLAPSRERARVPLEQWAYEALYYLAMHYATAGRPQEALALAERVKPCKPRAVDDRVHDALFSRALLYTGELDRALQAFAGVHDVENPRLSTRGGEAVEVLELWLDIARIHAARNRYEKAIAAYAVLAYSLGALVADPRRAPTVRLRFYFLQQMAFVVHELVSVWMTIAGPQLRQQLEVTVGNLLLQLKGNLFVALGFHRGVFGSLEDELFVAARRYAAAARKAASNPGDPNALLELEDAVRAREDVESSLVTAEITPSPAHSAVFSRDFRTNYILTDESLLIDYSLVNFQPPQEGLAGASRGLHYIGVGLRKGSLRVFDIGSADEVETLCAPLIRAVSVRPLPHEEVKGGEENLRQFRPPASDASRRPPVDVDAVSKSAYQRLVAPFEPLPRSLLFSADALLAGLPFHALLHEDRYLVEDRDVAYCYSLLQREALYYRQLSSSTAVRPPPVRSALLLGDPTYAPGRLAALPGTQIEIAEVARMLENRMTKRDDNPFPLEELRVKTGPDATVSQLLGVYQPLILHIAAHGTAEQGEARLYASRSLKFGAYYRRWQTILASPLSELDTALLRSVLMLAEDPATTGDPGSGLLTALELASLNLYHSLVVLSACETGAGATERGAGVLGFQYAVLATGAPSAMLSLWKVLDRETSNFMIDFYRNLPDEQRAKAAYLAATRKHCRRDGRRVHPYYWAAFIFLDQGRGM